jgi:hypothetical protein
VALQQAGEETRREREREDRGIGPDVGHWGVTTQQTAIFIVTAVRTSSHTSLKLSENRVLR